MKTFLSSTERQTLHLVCETLIPTLTPEQGDDPTLFSLSAAQMNIPAHVEDLLTRVTDDTQKQQLKLFLRLMETGFLNGLLAGQWAPFSQMPPAAREHVLFRLATSPLERMRTAFLTIKRPALYLYYAISGAAITGSANGGAVPSDKPVNPIWPGIGYHVPEQAAPTPKPIVPYQPNGARILETDVLVIGSGAGGGVVAGELAQAGYDVMVIEKGDYYSDSDFDNSEFHSMDAMYEKHASMVTNDGVMLILAGSVLGGGTTINWAASLRPPEMVLDEWVRDYGFTAARSPELAASLDAICVRLNVNSDESTANPNNAALERGCKALGYDIGVVPRNVRGCEDCGFCNFGCAFGAKQGTLKTYLQDAQQAGARIVVRGHVDRLLIEQETVRGAMVTLQEPDGLPKMVTIRAKAVVVSAGSLHTPALLLRSGLKNPNIGQHLHLHPTTVISGVYDEPILAWRGAPLARVSKEFSNLDGQGYGVALENAPAHPGIYGLVQPWVSGRQHKRTGQRMANTANIIIITRDRDGGRVVVDKGGQPVLHYRLSKYDARHLMTGLLAALRVQVAAGAKEVSTSHNDYPTYRVGQDGDLEAFLQSVKKRGLKPNHFGLYSAHQMSSCRIAGDAGRGAVKPNGETYEVKNLFVADASVLPTATGVNPMISIMGVAHYIAQHMKSLL
ncbi:MAG: GMC family oxidoreductase [Anaerolineae bacterium]